MARKRVHKSVSTKRIKLKGSKQFALIESTDKCWSSKSITYLTKKYKGISFIKVFPPANASKSLIANIKRYLIDNVGVEVVKVMPRETSSRIATKSKLTKKKNIRSTVIDYGTNVINSIDKPLLLTTLNETMDKAGL